jgi:hypothetical protein
MITALQLIFSPFETWEKITMSQKGFVWTFCLQLLPLLVVAVGIEGFLLHRWGEKRGDLGLVINVPVALALRYSIAYMLLLLAAVFVSAKFLALASESFNVHTTYLQSFLVMAYGFGPIILARVLDGIPQVNTWLCWLIGAAVSISVLYHGIGMVLRPEQTKGFGLYLIAIVIVVLTSGLSHFAAQAVLRGKVLKSPTVSRERAPESEGMVWRAPSAVLFEGTSWPIISCSGVESPADLKHS